jgi:hypothetical protein
MQKGLEWGTSTQYHMTRGVTAERVGRQGAYPVRPDPRPMEFAKNAGASGDGARAQPLGGWRLAI